MQAVEDGAEQAGAETYGERHVEARHRLADGKSLGLLIDLDDGGVLSQAHHLAHQARLADRYPVVEAQTCQIDGNRRTGDADYFAVHGESLTW